MKLIRDITFNNITGSYHTNVFSQNNFIPVYKDLIYTIDYPCFLMFYHDKINNTIESKAYAASAIKIQTSEITLSFDERIEILKNKYLKDNHIIVAIKSTLEGKSDANIYRCGIKHIAQIIRFANVIIDTDKELKYIKDNVESALGIKKCECGAEKCNLPHSDWCPKYEK